MKVAANYSTGGFVRSIPHRFYLVQFIVITLINLSASADFSLTALQKCEQNRLTSQNVEIDLPRFLVSNGTAHKFRITEKCATRLPHCMKSCPTPMTQLPISLIPLALPPPQLQPQNSTEENEETPLVIHFTPKGYFRYGFEYFSPDDFCLYSYQEDLLTLRICPSSCARNYAITSPSSKNSTALHQDENELFSDSASFEVCVPKCCSIHKVLDLRDESCGDTQTSVPWAPLVYRSESRQICGEKRTNLKLHYVQTQLPCDKVLKYFLKAIPGTSRVRFRLLTNGSVLLRELTGSSWKILKEGTYCLDGVQNYGDDPEPYSGDPMDQVLLRCGTEEDEKIGADTLSSVNISERSAEEMHIYTTPKEDRLTLSGILYIILLFLGVPFLLITAIVYILVWTKQNVHGWTQFSHTLAVLLHYLAQAVANIVSRIYNSEHNASSICRIVGISNHFFVLASFFWLTIINYDLFSMFRHLKTTVGRSRGLKRFISYMAIAWGIPFVVVLTSVILDTLYGLYGDDGDCEVDVIVPLYGHRTCYMVEDARPYYLFYPVGVLMVLNLVLAGLTFVNMYKHDQSAKMATAESRTKHRRKFSIMAKLFVVMGLVWIFEMFVWLFFKEGETLPFYLVFPDVFNVLQAIAIFYLFACQPKILNQVAESYPSLKGITEMLKRLSSCNGNSNSNSNKRQVKSNTTSSSSSTLPNSKTNGASSPTKDKVTV